ncbi:MAG: carboxylating nicotinate-nucleotide diphosphorylase [Nakamurella sp.]
MSGGTTRHDVLEDADDLRRVIEVALEEDLRYGPDVTTLATVPQGAVAVAALTPRVAGVLAGVGAAVEVFRAVGGDAIEVRSTLPDGSRLVAGEPALVVSGPTRALLTAERSALNLVTHLSGIATLTRAWVDAVAGTGARIRDTRKTLPGLRTLQKRAVLAGGGVNHRMGLGDAALIKDNHVVAAGSIGAAISAVRALDPEIFLEVEVDTLDQLSEALGHTVPLILLDNFSPTDTAEAVRITRERNPRTRLESSGGLTLAVARAYAETGVDFLAVGGLTHSAPSLDLGLDLTLGTTSDAPGSE